MGKIITLTTDFGTRDYFTGGMKGVILGINPEANIVDITHEVPSQDVWGAAYILGLGRWRWTPAVKAHLSALGFIFLALNAWSYQLAVYELAYSTRGVVFGASYTDVNAQWPAYNVLTVLTVALAVLLFALWYSTRIEAPPEPEEMDLHLVKHPRVHRIAESETDAEPESEPT